MNNTDSDWLKFIITGSVGDYLKYCDSRRKENIYGGASDAFFNRRPCNQRDERRGARPTCNTDDT